MNSAVGCSCASIVLAWLVLWVSLPMYQAFVPSAHSLSPSTSRRRLAANGLSTNTIHPATHHRHTVLHMAKPGTNMEPEEIKKQLQEYLQKRSELNADEVAKQEMGKIIGGTKGNKVLEYISGAPVKEQVIERIPDVFDYDQLTKYGYSRLVTPIMEMGGRNAVYELMGMVPPPPPPQKKVIQVPELKIDRTGEDDRARYSGLKLGQILDDDTMAEALARANEKAKRGERLRPKLVEEDYEIPYADKRNTGPKQTPEWTVERIDEYTKQQGKAIDWARRARLGDFVQDPMEVLDLDAIKRIYMVFTVMETALAFGKSSPQLLDMLGVTDSSGLLTALQAPGLVFLLVNLGSCILCGFSLAPPKNRSGAVWAIKGFLAGPLAVLELRNAEALITRGETEQRARDAAALKRQQVRQ